MDCLERCRLADAYHQQGFNCAQAVVAAFCDRTGLSEETALAIAGGFGGGMRCGEVCGALSGALMVLGLCHGHIHPNCPQEKAHISKLTVALTGRFREKFGALCCRELLSAPLKPTAGERAMAEELGITQHCAVLIVTTVELLENLLREQEAG